MKEVKSVTIETEWGSFTAKSLRAARNLAAAAKEEEAKKLADEQLRFGTALLKAQAKGFNVLWRLVAGIKTPSGWTLLRPDDEYLKFYFQPCAEPGEGTLLVGHGNLDALPVKIRFGVFLGALTDSGGTLMGYLTKRDADLKETFLSVAAEGDQWAECFVPGVTAEWLDPPAKDERTPVSMGDPVASNKE